MIGETFKIQESIELDLLRSVAEGVVKQQVGQQRWKGKYDKIELAKANIEGLYKNADGTGSKVSCLILNLST